jgi:hypothetical protein
MHYVHYNPPTDFQIKIKGNIMLDGFKDLFGSYFSGQTQTQTPTPTPTPTPTQERAQAPKKAPKKAPQTTQPEMTLEEAEILFVKAGGVQDLHREIEELKQQLRLRTDQLHKANEDRSSLRRELTEVKETLADVKDELKRRRDVSSSNEKSNVTDEDNAERKVRRNK